MNKRIAIIFVLYILFTLLCSCNNSNRNFSTDNLEFTLSKALIGFDSGSDTKISKTIPIYCKLRNNENNNNIIKKIENDVSNVQLIKNGKVVINSKKIKWSYSISSKLELVNLLIEFDEDIVLDNSTFDSIRFNNNSKQTYSVGLYHLYSQDLSPTKELAVIESPLYPNTYPEIGETSQVSYKIMMAEKRNNDSFNFKIILPEEFSKYISIRNVQYNYDENTTKELYKEYIKFKPKEDLKYFSIYNLDVTYILNEKTNIIFQPLIKAEINGKLACCRSNVPLTIISKE